MDFVFTSDLDWASDDCIKDLLGIADRFSLKPTLFVTHESAVTRAASRNGRADLGIHPNFRLGSDHGDEVSAVFNHVLQMAPQAAAFRAHHYIDSPEIAAAL